MSLSTKNTVSLALMKVGRKALNSYLLCQKGLEECTPTVLYLSPYLTSVSPHSPKITGAQVTPSKELQDFLDLRH